jgi:pyruvate dehydrogenase (quinone)/pyruvate oxidase
LDKLYENVAVYNQRIMGPAHVENVAELACRTALAYRGVAHITIPSDFQEMTSQKKRSARNVPNHVSDVMTHYVAVPGSNDLRRAADVLNAGEKVCILVGRGALGCADEIEAIAEKLGAPVVKALLGKAVLPDDSPYTTNTFGLLGTKPSQEAMEGCDTFLMVGSCNPYIEFYPDARKVRAVQIDHDPVRIGLRCPVEVGLVGDSRGTLAALLPLLKRNENRKFLEKAQSGMEDWRNLMDERANRTRKPMKPQVVAAELGKRLRSDAIVSCDSGTVATWWARHIPVKKGQMHSLSGNLATMANGLPYTIAAQIAYPDRQCVGFVGDGAFSMLMAEFSTAVKYKLPIKIVIIKNNMLGQIEWEQMVFLGNPEFACELEPIDFVAFAKACGGSGFAIEDPAECGEILERALATAGPVIIEARVDSHEPPMPPKATIAQAVKFGEALVRGTPDAAKIMKTVLVDKVHELV